MITKHGESKIGVRGMPVKWLEFCDRLIVAFYMELWCCGVVSKYM